MEPELPFIGMANEQQRLRVALESRESLAILGPPGCGKTRLIRETLSGQAGCQYLAWEPTLHRLLVALARVLIAAGHAEIESLARPAADPEEWPSKQTSLHLRGILWTALEKAPTILILDSISGASFPTYRFLQRLYHTAGMTLIVSARDAPAMGALNRLFWDPRRIMNISPLNGREARHLFDLAADRFNLQDLNLEEFREKALASACRNPGLIIEMCRLAKQPQYLAGRHVKFAPLRIDSLIRFTG